MDNTWLNNLVTDPVLLDILTKPHAYLDPGSGSYLIQLLIAGLLGGAFVIRAFWGKILTFFRGLLNREELDDDDEDDLEL